MTVELLDKIERLAQMIRQATGFYILTGAGVSTDSGIPDFRSPQTGLWQQNDPLKYSTAAVLARDPELFYRRGFRRFADLQKARPNAGHYAIAQLEEMGFLRGLVTQNIDNLHIRAGSHRVWEIHGQTRDCRCMDCGAVRPWQELEELVAGGSLPPRCSSCRTGVLRPNVVLFGDPMPAAFFAAQAALTARCDLLLVAGSSLQVYPAADLVRHARRLAIVNLEETPCDGVADLVIRSGCSAVLQGVIRILSGEDRQ